MSDSIKKAKKEGRKTYLASGLDYSKNSHPKGSAEHYAFNDGMTHAQRLEPAIALQKELSNKQEFWADKEYAASERLEADAKQKQESPYKCQRYKDMTGGR